MADTPAPAPQQPTPESPSLRPSVFWNPVSRQYEFPMEAIYADRQRARDDAEYEAYFGTTAVDTSQEGLDKAAENAQGARPGVTSNLESGSEQVRAKADQALQEPATRKAVDAVVKNWLGLSLDDLHKKVEDGSLPEAVSLKLMDPLSGQMEAIARQQAQQSGLDEEATNKIVGATGLLAGIVFPPIPGKGAKALRGAAAAAGERAMAGVTASRLEGAAPDIAQTIKNIGFFNAGRMEQGVVSHAETIGKAGGITLQQALKFDVARFEPNVVATAIAGHYKESVAYLTDLAKRAATGDATAAKDWWGAYAIAVDLAEKDALVGSALGRGLEARKIPLADINVPSMDQLRDFAAKIGQSDMDPVLAAQRYLELTPGQRTRMLTQVGSALRTGQNAIYEAWINMLLSGPQTHAANILSNTATAAWAPGERALSALMAAGESAITGKAPAVYFGESTAMLYGAVEGFKDGIRLLGRSLVEGGGGVGQKVEHAPAITAQAFHLNPDGAFGAAVDYLGAIVRTPTRLLVGEDELFKAVNFRMELRALAYREAAQEGKTGAAFAERVKEIVSGKDAAAFSSAKAKADQFALAQTFNQEIADLGPVARGLGMTAQTASNWIPLGRLILPFVRTPANILNYASELTPGLNLVATKVGRDIMNGGPEARALALGKFAAGGMVAGAITMYGMSPIDSENPVPYMTMVTGNGPTDKNQRATLERLGWRPFSWWDGSQYVAYNRLDPIGTVLGIVTSANEIMGQIPEAGVSEVADAVRIAIGKAMISKSFLKGLSDWMESQEGEPGKMKKFWEGLASSANPAAIKQFTREWDPIKREMDGLYDHWRAGLPGYDGPAWVNLWGDETMVPTGVGVPYLSPLYTVPFKRDDVDEWLAQNRIHPPAGAPKVAGGKMPPDLQMTEPLAKQGIKLTNEEHHRYGVLMGKGGDAPSIGVPVEMAGLPPLKDAVRAIINGPGTNGPEGTKADQIYARVRDYKALAELQLRRESPMLDQALKDLEDKRLRLKTDESAAPAPTGPKDATDLLKKLLPSIGR